MTSVLHPGDAISSEALPQAPNKTLTLGPGLRYEPPASVTATAAGRVNMDARKKAVWLEGSGHGRYVPALGDLVIATVHHSAAEVFMCSLSAHTALATLPQLAFEGASKKSRPNLQAGSLVYARVSSASKQTEAELECVHGSSGRSEGLGELSKGMLFEIRVGFARRLMMKQTRDDGGIAVLDAFAEQGHRFEIAVGRNGRVWVDSERRRLTLSIGRALQETDRRELSVVEQSQLVRQLCKELQR